MPDNNDDDTSDGSEIFHTPLCPPPAHQQTSTPTARGQFVKLARVGNITTDLNGTYNSETGDTFCQRPGYVRRIETFSTSSSDTDSSEQQKMCDMYLKRPRHWSDVPLRMWKYVDDFLAGERLSIDVTEFFFSTNKQKILIHVAGSERFFKSVAENATSIGMRVNESKTQLSCLSTAIDSHVNSYIKLEDGTEIRGGDHMKILGFYFGRKPNMDTHINELKKKVRMRTWVIRNLKRAGLNAPDLLKCYFSLIRPLIIAV